MSIKIDFSWIVMLAIVLLFVLYHITDSKNLLQFCIITLILTIVIFKLIIPMINGDHLVLDFLIIVMLTLCFFNVLNIFESELRFKVWLDARELVEYRLGIYSGISFIAALLGSNLERYLVEQKGISRNLLFLGITAFGTITVALYNFLGESAFQGTIYHQIAMKIKSTPESLTALITALGAVIVSVLKEFNKEKKQHEKKASN